MNGALLPTSKLWKSLMMMTRVHIEILFEVIFKIYPLIAQALEGDSVGVYQDVHLEMIETDGTAFLDVDIEHRSAPSQMQFLVNRPFMFMIKMDHELIGMGRVLVLQFICILNGKTRTFFSS